MFAQENENWSEPTFTINSVGIDIGSTTSHLSISRLTLARRADDSWGGFQIVERHVVHRSKVIFTPYIRYGEIDAQRLASFLSQAYAEANVRPEDIDTGAVIITGEAARKENAKEIVGLFAAQSGKFVCATAGPRLEAIMAAVGSGAVRSSRGLPENHRILNVDIGGATTKFALVKAGHVEETAAINVGARLVSYDEGGTIQHWERFGKLAAEAIGHGKDTGETLSPEEKNQLASALAKCVVEVIRGDEFSPLTQNLMITPFMRYRGKIDALIFSGGVAEYFYHREPTEFGDLGGPLAEALKKNLNGSCPAIVLDPVECLRATVIGASQYTVQVSGSTIFQSRDDLLPLNNVPVLLHPISKPFTKESLASSLMEKVTSSGMDNNGPLAIAFHLSLRSTYEVAKTIAQGVAELLKRPRFLASPLTLVFNQDIARTTGEILLRECQGTHDIISVDEIELREFDYIDIGEPFMKPMTISDHAIVPIVVKSLVFSC